MFLSTFDRQDFADNTAMVFADTKFTYRDIAREARRLAMALQAAEVQRGDLVALQFKNSPHFIVALLACRWVGAIAVPIRASESDTMLISWCNKLAIRCLLVAVQRIEALSRRLTEFTSCRRILAPGNVDISDDPTFQPVTTTPDEIAIIVHTSGTTTSPKGVCQSERAIEMHTRCFLESVLPYKSNDVVVATQELSHGLGMHAAALPVFSVGASLMVFSEFDPDHVLAEMVKHDATVVVAAPGYLAQLLQAARRMTKLPKLRLAISAADHLSPKIQSEWEQVFGKPLIECYGMTETCGIITTGGIGTLGRPFPGINLRVVGLDGDAADGIVGEVLVSGVSLFSGYWHDAAQTQEAIVNGWYKPGDMGVRDGQGCYRLVGRTGSMIKHRGVPVSPVAIEAALMEHDFVADCIVAGVPSDWGQDVEAFIVPKGGISEIELRAHANERLGSNHRPARYWVVGQIPRTWNGKLARNKVDELRTTARQLSASAHM